jgi:AraC family transcriptional regulator, ethanolamine operon transcriptional activator
LPATAAARSVNLMPDQPAASNASSLQTTQMLDFDPDVMSRAVQDGVLEHVQLQRGQFQGLIAHTSTACSRIDWGSYTLSVLARGDLSRDMVTIGMGLTGLGDFRVQGRPVVAMGMVVFPERGEMLAALPQGAQWLTVQLPRERLQRADLAMSRCLLGSARQLPGPADDELAQLLARLAPVLSPVSSGSIYDDAAVELAHGELVDELLALLAHRMSTGDAGVALSSSERWRVVRRAEAYLESQANPAVRIDELCGAAATSLSRLERAFRETFGMSPHRYLTLRRLAAVRRELLRGGAEISITEVATRWGFFHLGRFSQEYRTHFGEVPSRTLKMRRG